MKKGSLLKVSGVVTATLMLASAVSSTAYAGTISNKTAGSTNSESVSNASIVTEIQSEIKAIQFELKELQSTLLTDLGISKSVLSTPGGPMIAASGAQSNPGGPMLPASGAQSTPGGPMVPASGAQSNPGGPMLPVSGSQSSSGGSISTKSYSTSTEAANQITSIQGGKISGTPINLGHGITAEVSGAMGHARYEWQEGNWTIEIRFLTMSTGVKQAAENMVSYLHTHMLPAPNNHGVIIVNNTDTNKTFNPTTTIAWQEGNKVNELQQTGNPVQALQAVVNHK